MKKYMQEAELTRADLVLGAIAVAFATIVGWWLVFVGFAMIQAAAQ